MDHCLFGRCQLGNVDLEHQTMIKCRECENDISGRAVVCPHCGCPSKKLGGHNPFVRWLFRLAIVLCILVVGNALHKPFHNALKVLVPSGTARSANCQYILDFSVR